METIWLRKMYRDYNVKWKRSREKLQRCLSLYVPYARSFRIGKRRGIRLIRCFGARKAVNFRPRPCHSPFASERNEWMSFI